MLHSGVFSPCTVLSSELELISSRTSQDAPLAAAVEPWVPEGPIHLFIPTSGTVTSHMFIRGSALGTSDHSDLS